MIGAEFSEWLVVNAVRSMGLMLGAWLLYVWFRRAEANRKHFVWAIAFIGALLLPVISGLVSGSVFLEVPGYTQPRLSESGVAVQNSNRPVEEDPVSGSNLLGSLPTTAGDGMSLPASQPVTEFPWQNALVVLWAVVAGLLALRWTVAVLLAWALEKRFTLRVEPESLGLDRQALSAQARIRPDWTLRVGTGAFPATAMTWGMRKHRVLLPREAAQWPMETLRAVVLHELSHARRGDFLSLCLAHLACAAYWFNPLAWLGARAMRAEAEAAADAEVVRSGVAASVYAGILLDLAVALGDKRRPRLGLELPAMASQRIETRVKSLLGPNRRAGRSYLQTVAIAGVLGLSVIGLASLQIARISGQSSRAEETAENVVRMKKLAVATILYAADYDDNLPYVQSTASAVPLIAPYAFNMDVFQPVQPSSKFWFNPKTAGVNLSAVFAPSGTPLWFERQSGRKLGVVGFVDGHVELATPENTSSIEKGLSRNLPRLPGMRPLPSGYLVTAGGKPMYSQRRSWNTRTVPAESGPSVAVTASTSPAGRAAQGVPYGTAPAATLAVPGNTPRVSGSSATSSVPAASGSARIAPLPGEPVPAGATTAPTLVPGNASTAVASGQRSTPAGVPVAPTEATAPRGVVPMPPGSGATVATPLTTAGGRTTPSGDEGVAAVAVPSSASPAGARLHPQSGEAPVKASGIPAVPATDEWHSRGEAVAVPAAQNPRPVSVPKPPKVGYYYWDGKKYIPVPAPKANKPAAPPKPAKAKGTGKSKSGGR